MKLEFIKNNIFNIVEKIAPIGYYLKYLGYFSQCSKIREYKECDRGSCLKGRTYKCTVNRMRVITEFGESWCLDQSELPYFIITRGDE